MLTNTTNAHKCTDGLEAVSGNALKQRGFPFFGQPEKLCFAGCPKRETTVLKNLSGNRLVHFIFVLIRVNSWF